MRTHLLVTALALAACSTTAGVSPGAAAQGPLTVDVFPFDPPPAAFIDLKDSSPRTLRIEPSPTGEWARFILEVPGGEVREMRVSRVGASLYFSSGPGLGTELLRGGAVPGDAWESDGRRISFDSWERVAVPGGAFESARVTARRGPSGLEQTETWWFARGVGLVRMKSDHGSVWVDELVRSSP